jgi:hypothetical protein
MTHDAYVARQIATLGAFAAAWVQDGDIYATARCVLIEVSRLPEAIQPAIPTPWVAVDDLHRYVHHDHRNHALQTIAERLPHMERLAVALHYGLELTDRDEDDEAATYGTG